VVNWEDFLWGIFKWRLFDNGSGEYHKVGTVRMDFFVQTMDQITVIFVLSKKVSNKAHTMLKYCGDLSSCCSFPTRSYSFLPWSGLVWLVGRCRLHGPASGSGRSCIPADNMAPADRLYPNIQLQLCCSLIGGIFKQTWNIKDEVTVYFMLCISGYLHWPWIQRLPLHVP